MYSSAHWLYMWAYLYITLVILSCVLPVPEPDCPIFVCLHVCVQVVQYICSSAFPHQGSA